MPADDMDNHFTRRRVLALGAAPVVGSLLTGVVPASGAGARATRTVGVDLPAGAIPGGGRAGVIVGPGQPFDLVGLGGVDLRGAHAELRVRRRGRRWSAWVPLGAGADHGPDRPRAAPASDPVWAGGADELQLRARRTIAGGRLQLVTAPRAAVASMAAAPPGAAIRAAGAPPITPRASWGAETVPPRESPSYGAISLAFVHHTVSANSYAPEDSARIVLAIAKYHRDSNGWNDIGYNFLVDQYGQVFEGRAGGVEQAVIGAQAGGWNSKSTGIATIGDFESVVLPERALAVLARLIAWKLTLHGVPTSGTAVLESGGGSENRFAYGTQVTFNRVSGHRDGSKTACPGTQLYGQLDELRRRVAALGPVSEAAAGARATLLAVTPRVRYGQDAVLRGQVLRADGSAAADVPVSLQKRTSSGGWARVAAVRTNTDGTFESRVPYRREGTLRAQAQLSPGTAGRTLSPLVTVGLDGVVAVTSPGERSRVLAGRSVAVQGTVGPSGTVRVVVERQEAGGRWVAAGQVRAKVSKTAFGASVPLRRPGLYRLTAVGGTPHAPVRATPVFVRAVRSTSSLP